MSRYRHFIFPVIGLPVIGKRRPGAGKMGAHSLDCNIMRRVIFSGIFCVFKTVGVIAPSPLKIVLFENVSSIPPPAPLAGFPAPAMCKLDTRAAAKKPEKVGSFYDKHEKKFFHYVLAFT
jgi:hypothetical protein